MQIQKLDHVNVATTRLPEMVEWYETVLGLRSGPRPDFGFPGAWLYAGDTALVHMVGHDGAPKVGSEVALKLEHFAFSAKGRSGFERVLKERGQNYSTNDIPGIGVVQFHVSDPDGNHLHIDFPMDE